MNILALDSSTDVIAVAATDARGVVATRIRRALRPQSESLLPLIDAILEDAGWKPSDCALIAVATGPGSFNGIRGGIATAEGLALGLGIPTVGVPTLDALASPLIDRAVLVLSCLPAGRGEVYYAVYDRGGRGYPASPPGVGSIEEAVAGLPRDTLVCGRIPDDAIGVVSAAGFTLAPVTIADMRIASIAMIARERLTEPGFDSKESLQPLYLRRPGITTPTRPLSAVD